MNNIICIAGPTASGKTALAVELAGAGMTDQDREIFYRCLEQVAANLQTLCKNGFPTNE